MDIPYTFSNTHFECSTGANFIGGGHNLTFSECQMYVCGGNADFVGINYTSTNPLNKITFFKFHCYNYKKINIANAIVEASLGDYSFSTQSNVNESTININNSNVNSTVTFSAVAGGRTSSDFISINTSLGTPVTFNQNCQFADIAKTALSINNGTTTVDGCRFDHCLRGISYGNNSSGILYVYSTKFLYNTGKGNTAIYFKGANSLIYFNEFKNYNFSVQGFDGSMGVSWNFDIYNVTDPGHMFFRAQNTSSGVHQNNISQTAGQLDVGINFLLSTGWIENNAIASTDLQNAIGINVSLPTTTSWSYLTSVAGNQMNGNAIRISGSGNHLWTNTITHNTGDAISALLAPWNRYCFNNVTGLNGMNFSGNCNNTAIYKNKFMGGVTGLRANNVIGNQHVGANGPEVAQNEWTGTFSDIGARHTGSPGMISNSQIYAQTGLPWTPSVFPVNGWFYVPPTITIKASCSSDLYRPNVLTNTDIAVMRNKFKSSPLTEWMLKIDIVDKLKKNSSLATNSNLSALWQNRNNYLVTVADIYNELNLSFPSEAHLDAMKINHKAVEEAIKNKSKEQLSIPIDIRYKEYTLWAAKQKERNKIYDEIIGSSQSEILKNTKQQLKEKTKHLAITLDLLESFSPENEYEQLVKDALPLIIRTMMPGMDYILNGTERKQINYVGGLCPEIHGQIVILTRALMTELDLAATTTDCTVRPRTKISSQKNIAAEIPIFPNPAGDILYLADTESLSRVEVMDSNQKILLVPSFHDGIDISQLSSGVYFIKMYMDDADPILKRFIKLK